MTARTDRLEDWPAKQAIVDFVASATRDGRGFIPAADRIGTFDNDVRVTHQGDRGQPDGHDASDAARQVPHGRRVAGSYRIEACCLDSGCR
jgi:hypothetical protein